MNDGVLSRGFRIGDSDTEELVKVNPLLSEHMKLKLDLISKQPVSLETIDTEGLGDPLIKRFGW